MIKMICVFICIANMITYANAVEIIENQRESIIKNAMKVSDQETLNSPQLTPIFDFEQQSTKTHSDELQDQSKELWLETSVEQKKLAEEHEKEVENYSILNHKVYENDRIRVFNYTAYNIQQLKNNLINPNHTSSNELFLSFGYGMEYKINHLNKIGYEYISSFPYDNGQLLRFYWVRILTY